MLEGSHQKICWFCITENIMEQNNNQLRGYNTTEGFPREAAPKQSGLLLQNIAETFQDT